MSWACSILPLPRGHNTHPMAPYYPCKHGAANLLNHRNASWLFIRHAPGFTFSDAWASRKNSVTCLMPHLSLLLFNALITVLKSCSPLEQHSLKHMASKGRSATAQDLEVDTDNQNRGECGREKQESVMQYWSEEKQVAANKAGCNHHPKPSSSGPCTAKASIIVLI